MGQLPDVGEVPGPVLTMMRWRRRERRKCRLAGQPSSPLDRPCLYNPSPLSLHETPTLKNKKSPKKGGKKMEEISDSHSSSSEPRYPITNRNPNPNFYSKKKKEKKKKRLQRAQSQDQEELDSPPSWPLRRSSGVMLEGYVEAAGDGGDQGSDGAEPVGRTKSLTDEDLEELKGCLDLGFGFSYEEIPELCNTLPALELCYSMSQRFLDEQQQEAAAAAAAGDLGGSNAGASLPIANWKISTPGDHPEEVKARLKYWAQAVACTVRLCN